MVEKVIVIQNKETTEDGTLIITMQPVANARWTSNSGLIEAGVAVQPYGVFMIPDAETFVATGLMADVSINQVLFSTPLSALIAGDVEDEITFAAPYLNLTDLQDVTITSPSNGQALIWDATNSKWVNGSAGGGGGGEADSLTITEGIDPVSGDPVITADKTYAEIEALMVAGDMTITAAAVGIFDNVTVKLFKNLTARTGSGNIEFASAAQIIGGQYDSTTQTWTSFFIEQTIYSVNDQNEWIKYMYTAEANNAY